jgi:hypothetical protein
LKALGAAVRGPLLFSVLSGAALWLAPVIAPDGSAGSGIARAQTADADALAKEIDKTLRAAQRAMFNGKREEADAQLNQVSDRIDALRAADPGHGKLRNLESKYAKIRKDLDRRMGRTGAAKSSSGPAAPPPKPQPKAASGSAAPASGEAVVPREIRSDLKNATDKIAEAESQWAAGSGAERVEAVEPLVRSARYYQGNIEKKCGRQSVDCGPAEATLAALAGRIEAVEADMARSREETEAAEQAAQAAASAEAGAVEADAERMIALWEKYYPQLEKMRGRNIAYVTVGWGIEEAKAALAEIEAAEQVVPELSADLARLGQAYGATETDNSAELGMAINNALFEKLGSSPSGDPGGKLAQLMIAVRSIEATREATAEALAERARTSMDAWAHHLTDAQMEKLQKAKELLTVAVDIDPTSEALKDLRVRVDERIVEHAEKMSASIDAATWPGHMADFPGPGTAAGLAAEAKEYFENDRDWGAKPGVEILAVSVHGPWKVANRDVFGQVIRWRLPIYVAVTDDKLRPRNIARVYDLSIVAMEGAPNDAPKAPPFDGFWVGDNYMMRLDKF